MCFHSRSHKSDAQRGHTVGGHVESLDDGLLGIRLASPGFVTESYVDSSAIHTSLRYRQKADGGAKKVGRSR